MTMALPLRGRWERLPLPGADVTVFPDWMDGPAADALFAELREAIPWEFHRIRMFGREVASPRLSCWIGDADAVYTYSRTRFEPRPWSAVLEALRERVAQACDAPFNSVLANLYRDGNDAMGWHSDDEPELGTQPVIASLSLGATRRFRFRRRPDAAGGPTAPSNATVPLAHGSLMRMAGDTQRLYQHALPRSRTVPGPRINLTFRFIHASR